MFAPLYTCPTHGETWHVQRVEEIDTERDDIYEFVVCEKCGHSVTPLLHDGHHVVHVLSDEDMFWEMQSESGDE